MRPTFTTRLATLGLAVVMCGPAFTASGQNGRALTMVGGEADERLRLAPLTDSSAQDGGLLRSPSRFLTRSDHEGLRIGPLGPELRVIDNSALPFGPNEGGLWAGRGVNAMVTGGVVADWRSVRLVLAPSLLAEENRSFQVIPYPESTVPARSIWANPFHPPPESIDLPVRFGDDAHTRMTPGQSSLTITAGALDFGISTENEWWGPGVRNAIVMSNNAEGIPRLFLRPAAPRHTRFGEVDFDLMVGRPHDSPYFTQEPNGRVLTGGAISWHPTFERALSLGAARLRMDGTAGHAQMSSLFGRYTFPDAGFQVYVEWARFEDPKSLRDLLEFPQHSQGYTYGLQWAHPEVLHGMFRLQLETTYLEPDASLRVRPVLTSYTSNTVLEGFTERGQVIGAGIGPGSSSQWFSADVFRPLVRFGIFAERIRYDNGVVYEPIVPEVKRPDITVLAGLRASRSWRGITALVQLSNAVRLNYLNQSYLDDASNGRTSGVDIENRTLAMTLSTALPR